MPEPIIFFDGVCNLCNSFVDFVVRQDKASKLRFASLQGETAERILDTSLISQMGSVILYEDGKVYEQSDAVLRASGYLSAPWSWARVLRIVPRFVRETVYRWIAKNRYRWFGKKETCRVPTPEERARFLP